MKLTGRTILITGGAARIGVAFGLKFLELGNQVIVSGHRRTHRRIRPLELEIAGGRGVGVVPNPHH